MADANSVSDTQVLLHSMLQRLRLQPRPESNGTHTQDEVQYSTALIEQNGRATESPPKAPPMYNFDFSMDNKSIVTDLAGPLSPGPTGVMRSLSQEFAKGIDVHNSGMSSTPKWRTLSLGFMGNHTVSGGISDVSTPADDGVMPKQAWKQKFSLTKRSGGSVSSLQSVERLFPSTHTSGWMESNIQYQGVGQKKWTQKVKEKWMEKQKRISRREQDVRERQEQSKVARSSTAPIPVQTEPNENNTTTVSNEEVSVQHQPISNSPVEDIPSPLDHMRESLYSLGSFNLMEEIFTGQEWAKFLPSSTSSQSASSSITQDQDRGQTSNISQSRQNEQMMFSQWNYREDTGPNLEMTRSQRNSGSFFNMSTTEYMFNQRKTSSSGMPPMSQGLHKGQYGLSDSGSIHLESIDLSVSTLGSNFPDKEQVHINSYHQSNTTELNVNRSLSSEERVNQLQVTEINNNLPGSAHEILPIVDLSYLQSNDSSSLKTQVSLSRKRGHSIERSGSNERCSETGETHEWRHDSSHSDPAPNLSPASSTSSLQHSLSQDSELSMSTETVIKKRRVENTHRVRFAKEVTIIPPLVLSDDDGDADDEDYSHNSSEGIHDNGEESPSRQSVPRWIEVLRSKTKKPKLKLPRMRTKKYRFL